MIKLDISTLIFIYLLASVGGVVAAWIFFGHKHLRRYEGRRDTDYIWKCSICLNNYLDSGDEKVTVCPVCDSYNTRDPNSGG